MGYLSPLSPLQIRTAKPICLRQFAQPSLLDFFLAAPSAGKKMAASNATIPMTTNTSTSVNAAAFRGDALRFMLELCVRPRKLSSLGCRPGTIGRTLVVLAAERPMLTR